MDKYVKAKESAGKQKWSLGHRNQETAALLNVRFSHFSNTHTYTETHTHTRVSAGWPDAQRSRHSEGARELQLQCRCSLPYFIFTAEPSQSTQAGTNTCMQTRVSAER